MLLRFMALLAAAVHMVSAQVRGGGAVLHQGEADTQSVIVTDKTRAFLSCESGDMVVKVNFSQPFRGLLYAHRSRTSPCRMHGAGQLYLELRIPLKGCGTWQESPRVFVNNITIRFHPALELEEDETKTVVCRYPPPLTPAPGSIQVVEPPIIVPSTAPTRVGTARLSELEILIIICLLLFLSLLTLGIGIAYFCLRRRNIHIVRKSHAFSSAPPSQITRLSSSNLHAPPSSLLSSVLGHTVRIPRAVPYSAPPLRVGSADHAYEEYPASTSTAETSSAEFSETSGTSSSLADDSRLDSSRHLLYKKVVPRSLLSIPKAILRRTGNRRWPSLHQSHSRSRRAETEDQMVTTVLGSEAPPIEEDHYWRVDEVDEARQRNIQQRDSSHVTSSQKSPIPVYAQVEKPKKPPPPKAQAAPKEAGTGAPPRPPETEGRVVTQMPEVSKTSEEVTRNTTVTTSVRREVKETVILSSPEDNTISGPVRAGKQSEASRDPPQHTDRPGVEPIHRPPPKSILIRDVADVFLTTTVETESRELKTKTSKNVLQARRRRQQDPPDLVPPPEPPKQLEDTPQKIQTPPPFSTDGWNVVIRQRKSSPKKEQEKGTDLDPSDQSGEDNEDKTDAGKPASPMPQFDVKIRTIPPKELSPKKAEERVVIPPLEMPQTVSKLKEALMAASQPKEEALKKGATPEEKAPPKTTPIQRTVRWMDEPKDSEGSTVSSSDSFQSAESLRERSSSEVLEVAPTLPSQRRGSALHRPNLERSSSEMETGAADSQVRWIGGVVPEIEPLSTEIISRAPRVVARAGFFGGETKEEK